jgi:DNA-binding MarR family transcriptional regulator
VSDLSDEEYRSLAEFRHALRVFLRFSEEAARAEGLTPHQHQLLLAVRGAPEGTSPTVAELAERLQLRPNSALELARRAELAGWVHLRRDPQDQRRQHVELAADGARRLERLSQLHREELIGFRGRLGRLLDALDGDALDGDGSVVGEG